MTAVSKLGHARVVTLAIGGTEITPVEAPFTELPEKLSPTEAATAIGELVEALRSAGIFLPEGVDAPVADAEGDEA